MVNDRFDKMDKNNLTFEDDVEKHDYLKYQLNKRLSDVGWDLAMLEQEHYESSGYDSHFDDGYSFADGCFGFDDGASFVSVVYGVSDNLKADKYNDKELMLLVNLIDKHEWGYVAWMDDNFDDFMKYYSFEQNKIIDDCLAGNKFFGVPVVSSEHIKKETSYEVDRDEFVEYEKKLISDRVMNSINFDDIDLESDDKDKDIID